MAIGPVEGSPIPLFQAHAPFASEVAPASEPSVDALSAAGKGFLDLVVSANQRAQNANDMTQALASGQSDDIHGTMIADEQADISVRLLANVRNRAIDLYREMMRMGS